MREIWQLEEFQLRDRRVFINGWCLIPDQSLEKLELQLLDASGHLVGGFSLSAGNPRPDVQQAYQQYQHSLYAGFVGVGALPRQPGHDDKLMLSGILADGQDVVEYVIPIARFRLFLSPSPSPSPSPSASQRRKAAWFQFFVYVKRAIRLLRNGQFASLYEKLRRQLVGAPQKPLPHVLTRSTLLDLGANLDAGIHLVVDHRLGGGANHYRERMVEPWLQAGSAVLTLTYHLGSLQPMLVVDTAHQQQRFALSHESELLKALSQISLATVTYNTAVSFVEPELIPGLLLRLRRSHGAHLTVLVHDFFSICPSHFLIHSDGHYCGIPNLQSCRSCLHRNPHGFTSLYSGDVGQWRELWGPLLREADEVIAFSESSVQILRQAYEFWPDGFNWLEGRAITVQPHAVDYLNGDTVKVRQSSKLVIGVVGQIGFHKGAEVVRGLAQEIQREGSDERIAIIGSLEVGVNSAIVQQSGPYKHSELAKMIEQSGANVMLFPSVWPETFSYVTQEILELDLPLACLNLGAQAERVKNHHKGWVLSSSDPRLILQELRQLLKTSYNLQEAQ